MNRDTFRYPSALELIIEVYEKLAQFRLRIVEKLSLKKDPFEILARKMNKIKEAPSSTLLKALHEALKGDGFRNNPHYKEHHKGVKSWDDNSLFLELSGFLTEMKGGLEKIAKIQEGIEGSMSQERVVLNFSTEKDKDIEIEKVRISLGARIWRLVAILDEALIRGAH